MSRGKKNSVTAFTASYTCAYSEQVIFSVKAGHTSTPHIRDLIGVLQREKADIGVLISMREPTQPMRTEVASAGFYHSAIWGRDYPRMQLLTIADLLGGNGVDMPPLAQVNATFKKAPRAREPRAGIIKMPIEP